VVGRLAHVGSRKRATALRVIAQSGELRSSGQGHWLTDLGQPAMLILSDPASPRPSRSLLNALQRRRQVAWPEYRGRKEETHDGKSRMLEEFAATL
jgi:hypothetical protein